MHRFLTTLFLAAFGTILLQAQNWNQILSKEIEAEYFLLEKCYEKAALKYLEALDLYPQNANMLYKIGYNYLLTPDKKNTPLNTLNRQPKRFLWITILRPLKRPMLLRSVILLGEGLPDNQPV